ncbi:MAG: hypothetical protein WC675_03815 [Patescibacteria group bacterium]
MALQVYSFYLIVQDGQQFLGRANGVADCFGKFPSRFVALIAGGNRVASGETIQDGEFSTGVVERLLNEAEVAQILDGSEFTQRDFNVPALVELSAH